MKKKTLLRIIAPSLLAIAVSGGVIAGSTYALFTSNTDTNIAITAGKVNVSAAIDSIKLYSADPTLTSGELVPGGNELGSFASDYYYREMSSSSFLEGGTATYNAGDLTLDRMLPGDMLKAKFTVTNNSNVAVKYRLIAECLSSEEKDLKLFSNLVFDALGASKTNVKKYATTWQVWDIPTSEEDKVSKTDLKIAMPITLGNYFQSAQTDIKLSVEAVQANANTIDSEDELLVFKNDVVVNGATESGMADMVLTAGGTVSQPTVKVEVPTGTEHEVTAGGDDVSLGDELNLSVVENTASSSIIVGTDEESKNFEVTLKDQNGDAIQSSNTKLKVSIFVGEDKQVAKVYHNNVEVPAYDGTNEGYVIEDGYVIFYTDSFSPFTVVYKKDPLPVAVAVGEIKFYNFENFRDYVNGTGKYSGQPHDCAGEIVKLESDIDLSSVEDWTSIGTSSTWFKGIFDGQNHTVSGMKQKDHAAYMSGLFAYLNGNIKNLKMSNVNIEAKNKVNILAANVKGDVLIDNVIIDNTCKAKAKSGGNVSGLVGQVNCPAAIRITNTTVSAEITTKTDGRAAGFVSNTPNGSDTASVLYLNNCTFDGKLVLDSVTSCQTWYSAFISNHQQSASQGRDYGLHLVNCHNDGKVSNDNGETFVDNYNLYAVNTSEPQGAATIDNCYNGQTKITVDYAEQFVNHGYTHSSDKQILIGIDGTYYNYSLMTKTFVEDTSKLSFKYQLNDDKEFVVTIAQNETIKIDCMVNNGANQHIKHHFYKYVGIDETSVLAYGSKDWFSGTIYFDEMASNLYDQNGVQITQIVFDSTNNNKSAKFAWDATNEYWVFQGWIAY